jgi:proline iminopeptidase
MKNQKLAAARAWSIWEGSTSKLFFDPNRSKDSPTLSSRSPFARIECHYFMHNCFFPTDNYLIENIGKVRHIPGVIVRDVTMSCVR